MRELILWVIDPSESLFFLLSYLMITWYYKYTNQYTDLRLQEIIADLCHRQRHLLMTAQYNQTHIIDHFMLLLNTFLKARVIGWCSFILFRIAWLYSDYRLTGYMSILFYYFVWGIGYFILTTFGFCLLIICRDLVPQGINL